jgi:hypothetical protein
MDQASIRSFIGVAIALLLAIRALRGNCISDPMVCIYSILS